MQENVEDEADLVAADSHYWWERWLGPGKSGCTDGTEGREQLKKLNVSTAELFGF